MAALFVSVAARGFGMRVVGGKTGSDGRTFACIVWTVPGGPAEKAGLQQGDKVIPVFREIAIPKFAGSEIATGEGVFVRTLLFRVEHRATFYFRHVRSG